MRGTPLGWTHCPTCDRAVVVVTDAGVAKTGVHWMQVGRRCAASSQPLPDRWHVAKSLELLDPPTRGGAH